MFKLYMYTASLHVYMQWSARDDMLTQMTMQWSARDDILTQMTADKQVTKSLADTDYKRTLVPSDKFLDP